MAHEPDTYSQKFLTDHYALILNVSKTLTSQYEDLAHDVCIELTRCAECLKQVINPRTYIFVFARRINNRKKQRWENRKGGSIPNTPQEHEHVSPHTIQQEYYNSSLTSDDKFLLDIYLDNDAEIGKVAAAIHMSRQQVSTKIKTICTKLKSLEQA